MNFCKYGVNGALNISPFTPSCIDEPAIVTLSLNFCLASLLGGETLQPFVEVVTGCYRVRQLAQLLYA